MPPELAAVVAARVVGTIVVAAAVGAVFVGGTEVAVGSPQAVNTNVTSTSTVSSARRFLNLLVTSLLLRK